jgi:hypothetical protein
MIFETCEGPGEWEVPHKIGIWLEGELTSKRQILIRNILLGESQFLHFLINSNEAMKFGNHCIRRQWPLFLLYWI